MGECADGRTGLIYLTHILNVRPSPSPPYYIFCCFAHDAEIRAIDSSEPSRASDNAISRYV